MKWGILELGDYLEFGCGCKNGKKAGGRWEEEGNEKKESWELSNNKISGLVKNENGKD